MLTIQLDFYCGEKVWDSLTDKEVIIIGITWETGKKNKNDPRTACDCCGYWVDDPYLGGGRHPWELSKIKARIKNV